MAEVISLCWTASSASLLWCKAQVNACHVDMTKVMVIMEKWDVEGQQCTFQEFWIRESVEHL
jgi:hypothetical protein